MSDPSASSAPEIVVTIKSKKKPAKPLNAVINLVNAVIGAGVLGLPFAFAKAGLVPAILIFLMMLVFSYLSLRFLIYVSDATLVYSYGDVCRLPFFLCSFFFVLICIFSWLLPSLALLE